MELSNRQQNKKFQACLNQSTSKINMNI